MMLNEVCTPITPEEGQQLPDGHVAEVDITFFNHSEEVQQMLHPLALASRSVIFRKLWTNQGYCFSIIFVRQRESQDETLK